VGYFILNYLAWFVHLWMNNTMMLLFAAPHSHTPNPINIEFAFCMVWGLLYRGDCTLSTECPGITSALWLPPKHRSVQTCQHWINMTTWFKLKQQKHYSTNKTKTEPPTKKWIYPTKKWTKSTQNGDQTTDTWTSRRYVWRNSCSGPPIPAISGHHIS